MTKENTNPKAEDEKDKPVKKDEPKPNCGIIMPISGFDDYTESHWSGVKSILLQAIEQAGFKGDLVSEALETSIIHKTIVNNIYNNEMVVCDISGKNANVMFELGIRLTFDKPTVIVMDNSNKFSFDTQPIEHLIYPRDLNFHLINEFIEKLTEKIKNTYKISQTDASYSPFLKHFGDFVAPQINETTVPVEKYVIDSLEDLRRGITDLRRDINKVNNSKIASSTMLDPEIRNKVTYAFLNQEQTKDAYQYLKNKYDSIFEDIRLVRTRKGDRRIEVCFDSSVPKLFGDELARELIGKGYLIDTISYQGFVD